MSADLTPRIPAEPERRGAENLVLLGARGCGKTVVARLVARHLGWTWIDTDEQVETQTGLTIRQIFDRDGEAAFRIMESQVLALALAGAERVISAGGGAVLLDCNRALMRARALCVWLTAPAEELDRRLSADPHTATQRPALTGLSGLDEIRRILELRGPLYADLADHVVDTVGRDPGAVATLVVAWWHSQMRGPDARC